MLCLRDSPSFKILKNFPTDSEPHGIPSFGLKTKFYLASNLCCCVLTINLLNHFFKYKSFWQPLFTVPNF